MEISRLDQKWSMAFHGEVVLYCMIQRLWDQRNLGGRYSRWDGVFRQVLPHFHLKLAQCAINRTERNGNRQVKSEIPCLRARYRLPNHTETLGTMSCFHTYLRKHTQEFSKSSGADVCITELLCKLDKHPACPTKCFAPVWETSYRLFRCHTEHTLSLIYSARSTFSWNNCASKYLQLVVLHLERGANLGGKIGAKGQQRIEGGKRA